MPETCTLVETLSQPPMTKTRSLTRATYLLAAGTARGCTSTRFVAHVVYLLSSLGLLVVFPWPVARGKTLRICVHWHASWRPLTNPVLVMLLVMLAYCCRPWHHRLLLPVAVPVAATLGVVATYTNVSIVCAAGGGPWDEPLYLVCLV